MPDRASNLNMTKDVNDSVRPLAKKGNPNDLREVIKKYLENPTNSKSVKNTTQNQKEETNNKRRKEIAGQTERIESIDTKQKIIENVTNSLSLKSTSTDVGKAQNCQNVSKDEEKCVNVFNEIGEGKILPGHASNKDRNREIPSHVESPDNQLRNNEKLRIPGTRLKIDNLDVSMEGTAEMIGKDIAAKLNETRVDMVVALVGVIGMEAARGIFKETLKVEAGGGLMIKNGARRRTAGGTFFQLIREIRSSNIDMEKVNSVFERLNGLNEVEKMDSNCVKKGNVKLDRPCDYFNDTGICKFKSNHFSQSGFTRRIHSCRFCFYRHEVENEHPEIHCRLYRSYLNSIDRFFLSKEECSNKLQNGDVARQSKATAIEEILTGSNVVPIGVRSRQTEERKRHRGTMEQENLGSNSPRSFIMSAARSAIMSAKAETGISSQTEQHPPPTDQAASAAEDSVPNVCGTEIDRVTQDIGKTKNEISGNGCQRSKKIVQLKNSFEEEKDMKKAKEKLTMLSDQISKSVLKDHEGYQAKQELELVEVHSSVGNSMLSLKTEELASKKNMDCKMESQNDKDKKRKGKSCVKCLDKIQGRAKQGEILETKVEKKKFFEDVNRGKSLKIEVEKQEGNEGAREKHHNKEELKEKYEKKKDIAKNETIKDTAEKREKKSAKERKDKEIENDTNLEDNRLGIFAMNTPKKDNCQYAINGNGNGSKKGFFTKKDDKEQSKTAAANDSEKKQGNTVEDNKREDRNVDKRMLKPETKLWNSNTSPVNFSRQSKYAAEIPHSRLANSSKGNGNHKKNLHCPCPPYCPNCLNIVKEEKMG